MKLAIIGSRKFTGTELFIKTLQDLLAWLPGSTEGPLECIITGGAPGADTMAEAFGKTIGVPVIVHPADWETHGRSAGPIRNRTIITEATHVLAFWDGASRGTAGTLRVAEELGKPVWVVKTTQE